MRYFIHLVIDDFWTALINDRLVESQLKPHPYKEYREITEEERIIMKGRDHLIIFFYGKENSQALQRQSLMNDVAESFPDLAEKHKLKIDRTHEYWRKK